jgi:hypothetical protein
VAERGPETLAGDARGRNRGHAMPSPGSRERLRGGVRRANGCSGNSGRVQETAGRAPSDSLRPAIGEGPNRPRPSQRSAVLQGSSVFLAAVRNIRTDV